MNQSTAQDLVTDSNRDQLLAKYEIAILSVIFVLIVLGNSCLIIALVVARIKIQRMYYFIFHLSLSDLITAFANVLPQLIWEISVNFYGDNFLCKFVKYIQLLGPYLSSYVLVVTAIDRYQAICYPLANSTWTERRAKIMISVAWIIALLCCLPQVFIFSYENIAYTKFPNKTVMFKVLEPKEQIDSELEQYTTRYSECWGTFIKYGEKIYVLWYAISVFFIPLAVLVFTYFNICKVIWISARFSRTNKPKSTTKKACSRTLIFHSKLAASLSKQRGDKDGDLVNSDGRHNQQTLRTKLSNESETSLKFNSNKLTNEISAGELSSSLPANNKSELVKECCRAKQQPHRNVQNGQTNDQTNRQTNNQMNSQNVNSQSPDSKLTANQMKNASSIFASRTPAHTNKLSKAKIKTIKVTLVVIICYISCSLPFCSVQIYTHFWEIKNSSVWTGPLITITMLLPSLNSCVNPWIYLLLNRNLLFTLLKLLFGAKCVSSDYRAADTNQRLSISMHKTALATEIQQSTSAANNVHTSATNSPTQSPDLANSTNTNTNTNNVETILRKNRESRLRKMNNQLVLIKGESESNKTSVLNSVNSESKVDKVDREAADKNRHIKMNNFNNDKNNNRKESIKIDTVASLSVMNKINIECLANSELNKFNNLNRVTSETNSLNLPLTATKDQFIFNININKSSSSAPDLKH